MRGKRRRADLAAEWIDGQASQPTSALGPDEYDDREPIPGYGFDDCEVITGNQLEAPIRWKQSRPWPMIPEKRSLHVRIEITNETLFAFDFKKEPSG